MPVKKTRVRIDEIYIRETTSGTSTDGSVWEVLEQIVANQGGVYGDLDRMEDVAREILKRYVPGGDWDGPWPAKNLVDGPPIADTAWEVLFRAFETRRAMEEKDVDKVLYNALRLGIESEKMRIQPLSPLVDRGRRSIAGGRKGNKCQEFWRQERSKTHEKWVREDEKLEKRKQIKSARKRAILIGRKFKVKSETVRKRLREIRAR